MKRAGPIMIISLAAVLGFLFSLLAGPQGFGLPSGSEAAHLVVTEIRLPRAVLGFLIGGVLGLAGAVLQGYLRNPLAEPGLIGVSGGAALGAVTAIHSGLAAAVPLALPLGGFLGAGLATLTVMLLAGPATGPITLILAGVAVSSLAGALTSLALNLAPNPFAASEMLFWLMGSLTDRSLLHVWLAAPLMLAGSAILLSTRQALDALTLGEEAAQNLGVDMKGLRLRVIAGTALAVGAATAVSGAIGFVGLMVPHVLRPFFGNEPGRLLLPSFLAGAALVLFSDVTLRLLSPAGDLRLGVLTAILGAPFFIWLVLRTRPELGP